MTYRIDSILNKIDTLQAQERGQSNDLTHKLIAVYYANTLYNLKKIASKLNHVQGLEAFLAKNWQRIQGTALCYTALPDSDVTKLLSEAAYYVLQEKNKCRRLNEETQGVINILMPTVNPYSTVPTKYPDLLPTNASGHLDVDVDDILHTHIIGRDGLYLIPITYLKTVNESAGSDVFANYYYDFDEHTEEMTQLDDFERQRLREHSSLTEQLFTAKEQFEAFASDKNTLFGHLRILCSQLYYNSVDGVGQEKYAGDSAYLAISNLFEYYDKLERKELKQVPKPIKRELELIRNYASNKSTIGNLGSCLASRRSGLESAMSGHETLLLNIAVTGKNKQDLIEQAESQLHEANLEILEKIASKTYSEGTDKLGISLHLIRHFKLNVSFQRLEDLDTLKSLDAAAISEFCQDGRYQPQIVKAVNTLENLVLFSIELSPKQLDVFINSLGAPLFHRIIRESKDFAPLMAIFDSERQAIFWQAYKEKLRDKTKNANDFSSVMKALNTTQRLECYELFTPEDLVAMIHTPVDLNKTLQYLNPEKRVELFALFQLMRKEACSPYKDQLGQSSEYYDSIYQMIARKLPTMKEDPTEFSYEFMLIYGTGFIGIATIPLIKEILFQPYNSVGEFLLPLFFPLPLTLILIAESIALLTLILKTLYHLIRLDFGNAKETYELTKFVGLLTAASFILAAITSVLMAFSIVGRTLASLVTPITSRLSFFSCSTQQTPNQANVAHEETHEISPPHADDDMVAVQDETEQNRISR